MPVAAPVRGGTAAPLLVIDGDKLVVHEEGVTLLSKLDTEIAVLSIIGSKASGKSLLANSFFETFDGNHYVSGSSGKPPTYKGLYASVHRMEPKAGQRPMNVVLLDAQGVGQGKDHSSLEAKLFTIAALVSSSIVYNVAGELTLASLQLLIDRLLPQGHLVSYPDRVSTPVKSGSPQAREAETESADSAAPFFFWAARDNHGSFKDKSGKPVDATRYLEDLLIGAQNSALLDELFSVVLLCLVEVSVRPAPPRSALLFPAAPPHPLFSSPPPRPAPPRSSLPRRPAPPRSSLLRLTLRSGPACPLPNTPPRPAQRVECVCIPPPAATSTEALSLSSKPYPSLPASFRAQIDMLRQRTLASLLPKTICGGLLNGPLFVRLLRHYAARASTAASSSSSDGGAAGNGRASGSQGLPPLPAAWRAAVDAEFEDAAADCAAAYRQQLTAELQEKLPVEAAEMKEIHQRCRDAALSAFAAKPVPAGGDRTVHTTRLRAELKRAYREICAAYEEVCYAECVDCLNELYAPIDEKVGQEAYTTLEEYDVDRRVVLEEYMRIARRPKREAVVLEALLPKIYESVAKVTEKQRREWESERTALLERIDELEQLLVAKNLGGEVPRSTQVSGRISELVNREKELAGRVRELSEEIARMQEAHRDVVEGMEIKSRERERSLQAQVQMSVERLMDVERESLRSRLQHEEERARAEEALASATAAAEEAQKQLATAQQRALAAYTADLQAVEKRHRDEREAAEREGAAKVEGLVKELGEERAGRRKAIETARREAFEDAQRQLEQLYGRLIEGLTSTCESAREKANAASLRSIRPSMSTSSVPGTPSLYRSPSTSQPITPREGPSVPPLPLAALVAQQLAGVASPTAPASARGSGPGPTPRTTTSAAGGGAPPVLVPPTPHSSAIVS
eukprot:tig00020999_g16971.t1